MHWPCCSVAEQHANIQSFIFKTDSLVMWYPSALVMVWVPGFLIHGSRAKKWKVWIQFVVFFFVAYPCSKITMYLFHYEYWKVITVQWNMLFLAKYLTRNPSSLYLSVIWNKRWVMKLTAIITLLTGAKCCHRLCILMFITSYATLILNCTFLPLQILRNSIQFQAKQDS